MPTNSLYRVNARDFLLLIIFAWTRFVEYGLQKRTSLEILGSVSESYCSHQADYGGNMYLIMQDVTDSKRRCVDAARI